MGSRAKRKWYKPKKVKKLALNSQLLTVQILTNDVQVLILCLSYFITTVWNRNSNLKWSLPKICCDSAGDCKNTFTPLNNNKSRLFFSDSSGSTFMSFSKIYAESFITWPWWHRVQIMLLPLSSSTVENIPKSSIKKTNYCQISCVSNFCHNHELSSMTSWVGCLLTDSVLPDAWKLSKWEKHKFWEGFDYEFIIKSSNSTHHCGRN